MTAQLCAIFTLYVSNSSFDDFNYLAVVFACEEGYVLNNFQPITYDQPNFNEI